MKVTCENGAVQLTDAGTVHSMSLAQYEKHCACPEFAALGTATERKRVTDALAAEKSRLAAAAAAQDELTK